MEFGFDPAKSERNRREWGLGYGFAARIFLGRVSVAFARAEQGDIRMKAVGRIEDVCYAVIFTDAATSGGSSRPAAPTERKHSNGSRQNDIRPGRRLG